MSVGSQNLLTMIMQIVFTILVVVEIKDIELKLIAMLLVIIIGYLSRIYTLIPQPKGD